MATSGKNFLAYTGVDSPNPPQIWTNAQDPTPFDTLNVTVGDMWINYNTQNVFMLVSLANPAGNANWMPITVYAVFGAGQAINPRVFVMSGSGSPNGTITAALGSLYLNTAGNAVNNRAWVNTDGGTTWTYITTGV